MQQQAIEVASDAMDKFSIEKDIAQYIKKEVNTHPSPFRIRPCLDGDAEHGEQAAMNKNTNPLIPAVAGTQLAPRDTAGCLQRQTAFTNTWR